MSADRPNAVDAGEIGGGSAATPTTRRKTIIDSLDLGNRVIVYFSDGSTEIMDKGRLPSEGGGSGTSLETAQMSADTAAKDLAERYRQFNETLWNSKAAGDRDFNLSQELARGNLGVAQGRLSLDQLTQQQNYAKYLSDIAANPRNFMQTFFQSRGELPPGNAAQYGNGGAMPASAYEGGRLPGAGWTAEPPPTGAPPSYSRPLPGAGWTAQPPPGGARPPMTMPTAPVSRPADLSGQSAGVLSGLSGFASDGRVRLSPTDPDAARLLRERPGEYTMTSLPDAAPYLGQLRREGNSTNTHFARGGVTPEPMTAVGDWSGQTYRIGERGPEGIVPADYLPKFLQQRHGHMGAYGSGGLLGYDPYNTDTIDPGYGVRPPPDTSTLDPYGKTPPDTSMLDPYGKTPPGMPGIGMPPVKGTFGESGSAGMPVALNSPIQPITSEPPPGSQPPSYTQPLPGGGWTPEAPPVSRPIQLPQNGTTSGPNVPGSVTPRVVAPAGTFGGISGASPVFLPGEDHGAVLQSLIDAGSLPPFLTRLFSQRRGIQSQGTNMPQDFNLPSDVPLPSLLAWSQMQPSEQEAMLSYASSYGITPQDYIQAIRASAPQGGAAQSPLFGNQFFYGRQ